ncbi:adenylate/guanylate cyclase domain-containing protein [Phormidium sp. CCY1219]|uniref:adenylate/guanylate cyclase domain-containing protein n=1 Tax=Phormidium sp. CCY1219 TaxID=2886104 RepID=UPI002D1E78AF|nr:adenylate/guanylate cyclase domain-containing protein [Phormidium sp. CCY1219]MEB3827851.1 hypothetical protein [Phormidium sp. CCY1219]
MPKLKITIRVSILALLTLLVVLSSGMVGVVSYLGSQHSIRLLTINLMREISDRVIEKTLTYLKGAVRGSQLNVSLTQNDLIQPENRDELVQYFSGLMTANEQFITLTYGETSGDFIMLKRMPDNSYSVKTVSREGEEAISTWQHENKVWSTIYPAQVVEPAEKGFDPRSRPWYEKAIAQGEFIWTDVYIFYSDLQPGISSAAPIYDSAGNLEGVMGIDITIAELSYFLGRLTIGKEGKAFIFNDRDRAIALPIQPDEEVVSQLMQSPDPDMEGNDRTILVENVRDPAIAASFRQFKQTVATMQNSPLQQQEPFYFSFYLDGTKYLAMYAPFPAQTGLDWFIGAIVPEKDFMAQVHLNNAIAFAMSCGLVATAVILGFLFAQKISHPLALLARETDKIKQFKLTSDKKVESFLIEVENMGEAFYNMTKGLRSFKKYVPASLVRELISLDKEACLGGEKRELTIYFSDLANFTAIAENLEPEKLVEGLGEYLSEMSHIVFRYKGTVDKYIGDSIMAFWGAPTPLDNHAVLACHAALATQRRMVELALEWEKSGKTVFHDRIGIATGDVIVGNMGAEERLNYTAIGDPVNLASRLEGLNKYYGTKILISESTYEQAQDYIEVRLLDFVAVKGKRKPVGVYELISEKDNLSSYTKMFIRLFSEGVKLYRERQWSEALKVFEETHRLDPQDKASEIFMHRCQVYEQNPPNAEWKGVFVWRAVPTSNWYES